MSQALQNQDLDATALFETVSRYVADECHRVDLENLVLRETRRLLEQLPDHHVPQDPNRSATGEIAERIAIYERFSINLLAVVSSGCYWGQPIHHRLWSRTISQIAALPGEEHGQSIRPDLRRYPALLMLYASGISAIASGRYETLASVLLESEVRDFYDSRRYVPSILELLLHDSALPSRALSEISNVGETFGPIDHYLHSLLKPLFANLYITDIEFDN